MRTKHQDSLFRAFNVKLPSCGRAKLRLALYQRIRPMMWRNSLPSGVQRVDERGAGPGHPRQEGHPKSGITNTEMF